MYSSLHTNTTHHILSALSRRLVSFLCYLGVFLYLIGIIQQVDDTDCTEYEFVRLYDTGAF